MMIHLTAHETENLKLFVAHPRAREFPNDPRAIFSVRAAQAVHYRASATSALSHGCNELARRDTILALDAERQARAALAAWRRRRING